MFDRVHDSFSTIIEVATVCGRIVLWLALFAGLLFGLFTYPLLTLVGFIFVYASLHYVRRAKA